MTSNSAPSSAVSPVHPLRVPGPCDHSYVLGPHGFIYASSRIASGFTVRHAAVLLVSVDRRPFELALEGAEPFRSTAAVVAPRVARSLNARGLPLLSFNIMPSHTAFHVFRALQRPGVLDIDREAFEPFSSAFHALHQGQADLADAAHAFEHAVAEAVRQLPPAPAPDPRAFEFIHAIEAEPGLTLDALALQFKRSSQAMSRLFSSAVGMSLRDYQGWLKQRRVMRLLCTTRSLTDVAQDAGFADSPELSRTFQRWYGQSPSFTRDPKFVRTLTPRRSPPVDSDGEKAPGQAAQGRG